jgi:hypothetical protein
MTTLAELDALAAQSRRYLPHIEIDLKDGSVVRCVKSDRIDEVLLRADLVFLAPPTADTEIRFRELLKRDATRRGNERR